MTGCEGPKVEHSALILTFIGKLLPNGDRCRTNAQALEENAKKLGDTMNIAGHRKEKNEGFVNNEAEAICKVQKGGIMIMKPLLLHSSGRATNSNKRRVVHIEFSRYELPGGLLWAERALHRFRRVAIAFDRDIICATVEIQAATFSFVNPMAVSV